MRAVVKTAFLYIRYYKKQTLAILLGIVFSMALLSGISSLVYSGSQSQLENARKVSGDWHYYVQADDERVQKIQSNMEGKQYEIVKTGIFQKKKMVEEPYVISMVYGDKNYMEMMGLSFKEGKYPAGADEIALDEYTLGNILPGGTVGDGIELDGICYTITGILSKESVMEETEMRTFVSEGMPVQEGQQRLYMKFEENKPLYSQMKSMLKELKINVEYFSNNWEVVSFLGGASATLFFNIVKEGMGMPEGKAGYILGSLNESFHLTENAVRIVLAVFAGFIIYSIFSISVWKRISQYGILQVVGVGEKSLFGMLLCELWLLFVVGFPAGILVGNASASMIYSRFSRIFTGGLSEKAKFFVDEKTIWFGMIFLLVFLTAVSWFLVRKINRMTMMQMIRQESGRGRKNRRIYSMKTERMTSVLTRKFMFQKKGTFVGILISLSIGGIVFLSANYVIINTEKNNELTMKADDGLGSDMELFMESSELNQVIPENAARQIKSSQEFKDVYAVSYLLGELSFMNGEWTWPTYYAESAVKTEPERAKGIDPGIMEAYNGRITDEGDGNYKIKTNVYGYDEGMLAELKEFLLEGEIDPREMEKENTVVLQTVVDGQGNYDGLDVKAGDTITLKVPKSQNVEAEVLRFQSPADMYIEKEFLVSAVVSRSLGTNDFFIGGDNSCLSVIMTNQQMRGNYNVQGYTAFSLMLKDRANNQEAARNLKETVSGIDRCILKDYTSEIDRQNAYLQQKMFFYYGVAVILLVISMFHIMNSMNYLVISRRHEFGILRAMGITDEGFLKMMLREGIFYGICAGIATLAGFVIMKQIILYFLEHVYLYVYVGGSVSWFTIGMILAVNLIVGAVAVCIPAKRILDDNVIEEIAQG